MHADVLIVGSGGAALRAAIAARATCPEGTVVIATKGRIGKSGVTANACSDRMAFHATLPSTPPGEADNWRYQADDVYEIGGCVSDRDLAAILAQRSADAFAYLDELGVPFVRNNDGEPDQFLTDGSQYPRALYTGPYTAIDIEQALVKEAKLHNLVVLENTTVFQLVVDSEGQRILGAFAITEEQDDTMIVFQTNNVILATGGAGELYKTHVFTVDNTGSGYAMAYEAGAQLTNMEFIQFGLACVHTKLALSGSFMRAVPRFVNDLDEEFLLKYLPADFSYKNLTNTVFRKGFAWPITSEQMSSLLDVAVYKEVMSGRDVFLDYERNPTGFNFEQLEPELRDHYFREQVQDLGAHSRQEKPLNRLKEINPSALVWLEDRRVNLEEGAKIQIAPAAQHFQGGVKIREQGNTNILGLFAVGEAAGGQHGANRPGGHALLDCQVFGEIAGEAAAIAAQERPVEGVSAEEISKVMAEVNEIKFGSGRPASIVRQAIQELMHQAASVVRTEQRLEEALKTLEKIKKNQVKADEKGLVFAIETKLLLHVAEMVLKACQCRKESRGPHLYFDDYQAVLPIGRCDTWEKYIVICKEDGEMTLKKAQPVTGLSYT